MKKIVKETSKKIALGALTILATIGSVLAAGTQQLDFSSSPAEFTLDQTKDESEGTITVKAFSTEKDFTYKTKVTFGDMKYVYDNGTVDPATNHVTKKHINNEWAFCEIAAGLNGAAATPSTSLSEGTGVGYWCGFDGDKNHVSVENLGNGDIDLKVSSNDNVSSAYPNPGADQSTIDIQIAVKDTDVSPSGDKWTIEPTTGTLSDAIMHVGGYATSTTQSMKVATLADGLATALIQKKTDIHGSQSTQADANSVEFWINLHNAPSDGVYRHNVDNPYDIDADGDESTCWSEIGSFTLTFTAAGDSHVDG